MSVQKAKDYLKQWNLEDRIREFDVSSATVELAAQALNCEPERIAKTLSFKIADACILIVAAGDAKVDNTKFKGLFNTKATMLSANEVETFTGYQIGGVCPFGVKEDVEIYLDISLKRFETIFPACGSNSSAVELSPAELEKCSNGGKWVDVCKGWQ